MLSPSAGPGATRPRWSGPPKVTLIRPRRFAGERMSPPALPSSWNDPDFPTRRSPLIGRNQAGMRSGSVSASPDVLDRRVVRATRDADGFAASSADWVLTARWIALISLAISIILGPSLRWPNGWGAGRLTRSPLVARRRCRRPRAEFRWRGRRGVGSEPAELVEPHVDLL